MVLEVLSIIITAGGVVVAIIALKKSNKIGKQQMGLGKKANDIAEEQKQISERANNIALEQKELNEKTHKLEVEQAEIGKRTFVQQYYESLRQWADESVNSLANIMALCDIDPDVIGKDYRLRQINSLNELSAIIDRGRWFFPNDKTTDFGSEKEDAYKGFRHEVLDCLVYSFKKAAKSDWEDKSSRSSIKSEVDKHRRQFVSLVQGVINPEEIQKKINELRPPN